VLAPAAALLLPGPSHAHLVNTGLGPFYDGVSHFALTPEDLLPALALALLAGQRGSRAGRLTLFSRPMAWLLGGFLGLVFPTIDSATALTTLSFLALGGLLTAKARLQPEWVTGLAVVVGLLHGHLNGAAMVGRNACRVPYAPGRSRLASRHLPWPHRWGGQPPRPRD